MGREHKAGCARLQFWDAGEFDAPCTCNPDHDEVLDDAIERVEHILALIKRFGGNDGGDHKQWVLDQIVRILTGSDYPKWVEEYQAGEDGPYIWEQGVPP